MDNRNDSMNKITLLIVILILIVSCNNQTKNDIQEGIVTIGKDTVTSSKTVLTEISVSNFFEINSDTYYAAIDLAKDTISDFKKYKLQEFTRLKQGQTQFKYYLLDELNINNSFQSLLIAEYYESEQACWLVNYDKNYNPISAYEVFYDNAEGAWNTSTSIDLEKGILNIKQYDAYAVPEEKTRLVKINQEGQFIEQ